MSESDRQAKLAELSRCRSKLSMEEAALLREVFVDIFEAHDEQVWDYIRRRVASRDDAEELCHDVFLRLYTYIVKRGFIDNIRGMLMAMSNRKVSTNPLQPLGEQRLAVN